MTSRAAASSTNRYRIIALALFSLIALAALVAPRFIATANGASIEAEPQARASAQQRRRGAVVRPPRVDYTHFSHRTAQHQLACDNCHKFPSSNWRQVRKKDDAFPDIAEYPEHQSCLRCHRQQFFARERPAPAICSVCHVANSPRNTTRYPFPSLGATFLNSPRGAGFTSDFQVFFPHDKHIEIVGQLQPTDTPERTVSFVNASFTQEKKEQKEAKLADSPDKSCVVCHQTYLPQGTSDQEYVTPTSDDGGALNLELDGRKASATFQCAKCHLLYGGAQTPASHAKAVEAFKQK